MMEILNRHKLNYGTRYNTEEQPVNYETPSHRNSDLLEVRTRVKINQKSTLYVVQCWLTKY